MVIVEIANPNKSNLLISFTKTKERIHIDIPQDENAILSVINDLCLHRGGDLYASC